jgi:signal peptidase
MSSKKGKILYGIATAFIVLVVVMAALVTILSLSSKEDDIPSLFGYTAFSIQSDSMEDKIMTGDFIIGKKCDPKQLKEREIISFFTVNNEGQIFINTHRIIGIEETSDGRIFTTKGDNENEPDLRKVLEGDIVSKYSGFRIPLLGYIITFLTTQLGFFLCIVFPVLLYTIWQVYILVVTIMNNQKVKMLEEVKEQTSEEAKQAIIAEYLAQQKLKEENNESNTNN